LPASETGNVEEPMRNETGSHPATADNERRTPMKSATFVYTELSTHAARKAREFYGELFGWQYQDVPGPHQYALVQSGGQVIGGIAGGQKNNQWLPYVGVADIKAATAKAKELGATAEVECRNFGDMGTASVLVDPTGARFALWQAGG